MNLTEIEKAYLAGLFDGEGCVGYYKRMTKQVPYHSASLHVCMTDPRPVQWVMDKVSYGKISISYKANSRRTVYSWQLCNKPQIQEVLEAIRPYLIVKGDQVDVILSHWKLEERLPKGVTPELIAQRESVIERLRILKAS